jgi:hypothetical protein
MEQNMKDARDTRHPSAEVRTKLSSTSEFAPPLTFPARDVVIEAARVFATNPFGFEPKSRFWREIGATCGVEVRQSILRNSLHSGLLLPPGDLFGAPHGYLPGPAAFAREASIASIPGLPDRPSAEEILHNARARTLSRVVQLITENGQPSASDVATALNLPPGTADKVVASLQQEGFLSLHQSRLLPTDKMEYFLGQPGLVERIKSRAPSAESGRASSYHTKRAEAEKVFQTVRDPLLRLVSDRPGSTAHELFAMTPTIGDWMPAETSKAQFIRWLDKLVEQSALVAQRQRQGPVRIVQLYYIAGGHEKVPGSGETSPCR